MWFFFRNLFYHCAMGTFARCQLDCLNCQTIALSVFGTLKRDELSDLNKHKMSLEVKKGSVIFYENNLPSGFYCVHKGKVKVYKTADNGDIQITRLAKDGNIIGYRSMLANEPYKGTAETIEDSIICFIPRHAILELIGKNLDFSLKIMESFAEELDLAQKRSLDILYKSSKERLAEALILLSESFGVDARGFIQIKLTRAELAAITGMVHETVVRTLTEWEKDGLLELDKKLIRIADRRKLLKLTQLED
ncbi:MAG: Crp/Fnr family transcriptional regulator [Bacteroidetes bacterium]|nr:Crp/Fnr family transcriptional regulator [Bacteroidota bacterium]